MKKYFLASVLLFSHFSLNASELERYIKSLDKTTFAFEAKEDFQREIRQKISTCNKSWEYTVLSKKEIFDLYKSTRQTLLLGISDTSLSELKKEFSVFGERILLGISPQKLIDIPNIELKNIPALHISSVPGDYKRVEVAIKKHIDKSFFPKKLVLNIAVKNFANKEAMLATLIKLSEEIKSARKESIELSYMLLPGATKVAFTTEENKFISSTMSFVSKELLMKKIVSEVWIASDGYRAEKVKKGLPNEFRKNIKTMQHEFVNRDGSRLKKETDGLYIITGNKESFRKNEGAPIQYWLGEPTGVSLYLNDMNFRNFIDTCKVGK